MSLLNKEHASKTRMSVIESVLFVFIFILPFFFYSISSDETEGELVQYLAFASFALLFVFKSKYLFKVMKGPYFAIVLLYLSGIVIKFIFHGKISIMGAIMPIVGIYGYYYIDSKRIKLRVFDFLLIGLYIYYISTFYLQLNGFFIRSALENEGAFFGRSSSNAIPIVLINVLYVYQVVAFLQKENKKNLFLLYSSINLILILIQQSRSGILIGSVFFLYNLFMVGKGSKNILFRMIPIIIVIVVSVFLIRAGVIISEYTDQLGEGGFSYGDTRGIQAASFFEKMDFETFLIGYPPKTKFGNETYVYNTFLNQWNIYTLIGFCTTLVLLIRRFVGYKKYYFPWFFLVPFIMYSFSEPRYLPNYWDFFIYLMLLKKV